MKTIQLLNYADVNFNGKLYNSYVTIEGEGFEVGGCCMAPDDLQVGDKTMYEDEECTIINIHWYNKEDK